MDEYMYVCMFGTQRQLSTPHNVVLVHLVSTLTQPNHTSSLHTAIVWPTQEHKHGESKEGETKAEGKEERDEEAKDGESKTGSDSDGENTSTASNTHGDSAPASGAQKCCCVIS